MIFDDDESFDEMSSLAIKLFFSLLSFTLFAGVTSGAVKLALALVLSFASKKNESIDFCALLCVELDAVVEESIAQCADIVAKPKGLAV